MIEVAQMFLEEGINRFKCATIAEADMLAIAGAEDVLLAYQPKRLCTWLKTILIQRDGRLLPGTEPSLFRIEKTIYS